LSVESPEFKRALQEACEGQYRGWLYGGGVVSSKDKIGGTMDEVQRQRREIEEKVEGARLRADRVREEARIMSDPHLREITENLRKLHSVESGVVCPQCGETNSHGNKMNGKPFCFKCQLLMISKEKAEKWVKPQPKPKSYTFKDVDVARVRK